jgi:soluble lytic murein transglycosylase-like protein
MPMLILETPRGSLMSIFSEMAAIQSRIDSLSGAQPTQQVAAVANISGLAGPPMDPNAGAHFQSMISEALSRSGDSGEGYASSAIPPAQLEPVIRQSAAAYQVDPSLVKAIIANESGFNPSATSPVGAQGLMQLMPSTAASLGVQNSYDPVQNIQGGTRYLRGLYDRFGDWKLAVAAYNAGPEAVHKYGGVPPYRETQNYVQNVMASQQKYALTQVAQHSGAFRITGLWYNEGSSSQQPRSS